MQVKKQAHPWKHAERFSVFRAHRDVLPHTTHSKSATHTVEETQSKRSLQADVLFFVDHAITVAVSSVARKQAQSARLMLTCKSGANLHVSVGTTGEGEGFRFVAYNNDMCLFVGSSPTLYVADQTAREIEHSIYLYLSERLCGEPSVTAQIFRETGTMFELPILEGSSVLGPNSLKARTPNVLVD